MFWRDEKEMWERVIESLFLTETLSVRPGLFMTTKYLNIFNCGHNVLIEELHKIFQASFLGFFQ